MTTRPAYQFDHAGLLVGVTDADESPLEPGVFLLPARCTFKAPPGNVPDDKRPRWDGSKWRLANRASMAAGRENTLAKLQAFLTANPDVAGLIETGGV